MYIFTTIILISLLIGVAARFYMPNFCKSFTKFCLSKKWWIYLTGFIMTTVLAYISFNQEQNFYTYLFSTVALLQLFSFFYGFYEITPEQEELIDKSD